MTNQRATERPRKALAASAAPFAPSITKPAKRSGVTTGPAAEAERLACFSTAGKLLFTGDPDGHLVAFDPANGRVLWHAGLAANISNGPETYMLDGRQYLVVGAGDSLYAFTVNK